MTMESLSDTRCSGGGGEGAGDAGSENAAAPSTPANSTSSASPSTNGGMQQDDEEDDECHDQHNDAGSSSNAPTSREMRNRAEKQRRDKLNTYIHELAQINPFIKTNEKKLDKTSVLRLSAAWMRYNKYYDALVQESTPAASTQPALPCDSLNNNGKDEGHFDVSATPDSVVPVRAVPSSTSSSSTRSSSRFAYSGDLPIPDNLTEHMLESMSCILLLVSASGKIVFVSSSVSKILGHSQNDLMGQSLYSITCSTDHDTLRKNLQFNLDESEPGPSHRSDGMKQRKNFFLKLSQKTTSRSDSSQYEIFNIIGNLQVLGGTNGGSSSDAQSTQICRKNVNRRDSGNTPSQNQPETVLVGIAKIAGLRSFDLVKMDANKEEYFTRHSLEGDIVYCDQRISITAGYMVDEVYGLSAFRFMHNEDVGWCLVSLRQMYSKGGGFGTSTYRLQNKTGDFIFLRTHGHLEFDKETNKPISFLCINTLLSESEGWKGLEEMKERFSAQVKKEAIMPAEDSDKKPKIEKKEKCEKSTTMEHNKLEELITNHLCNISPSVKPCIEEVPDPEYLKCMAISKQLPPPSISIRSMKRRESISSQSPQHNPMSPDSPQAPKSVVSQFKSPSPPLFPLPDPEQLENTQAVLSTAKGTCLGRARIRRREPELLLVKPAKQSRRGRPRGSGGVKRKAKTEAPAANKKALETSTLYETDDGALACLNDSLEWMEGSPSIFFGSSTSIFDGELSMLDDFTDSTRPDDDLLLPLSPSHHELQIHHQKASESIEIDSLDETALVRGTLHHLKSSKESPPDIGK